MNKVILSGNVVRDAEVGDTANGSKRCAFSLAVSEKRGEKKTVNFVPIVAWGNLAEPIAKYAAKGARLLVDGELSVRAFKKTDGKKGVMTEVVVEKFEYLGKSSADETSETEEDGE
ncbi:MAG: single-stranded DNA-binding protein [Clostridiales bacterium]|nr:single-stranded DNA-binding protein [Clostridiales bacterium]